MYSRELETHPEKERKCMVFLYTWDYTRSGGDIYYVSAIGSSNNIEERQSGDSNLEETLFQLIECKGFNISGLNIDISWNAPEYLKKYIDPEDPETTFVYGSIPIEKRANIIEYLQNKGAIVSKSSFNEIGLSDNN